MEFNEPIKSLAFKQPYAGLMFYSKVETRTWNTKYRGLVLICASMKPYNYDQVVAISGHHELERIIQIAPNDEAAFVNGMAIGIGRLVDCRPLDPKDNSFVTYREGLFGLHFEDVRRIKPFKLKNRLGFHNISDEVEQKIELL